LAEITSWKWLYCQKQSRCSVQSPSKFQWHSSQRLKNQPEIHVEPQKASNSQGNTEKKEKHWKYHNSWLQTILQSHNNKKQDGAGTKPDTKTKGTE
jgi:hypothetical protein